MQFATTANQKLQKALNGEETEEDDLLVEGDIEDQVKEELNEIELKNLVCHRDNA